MKWTFCSENQSFWHGAEIVGDVEITNIFF
jgi:hypothetical protein